MKSIAIIPARGGSKGIKRKNVKKFCGKPLISHIIKTAKQVKELDRIIVSTEDKEIADISKEYGAEVPFLRPKKLAEDKTPTLPVLHHCIRYLEEKENYKTDIVVLLYATFPLLKPERISEAIRMIEKEKFDSVISVVKDYKHYWTENKNNYVRLYPKIVKNRQFVKPLYKENGALYISRRDLLIKNEEIVGGKIGFLLMEKEESEEIDDPIDFKIAEFLCQLNNR